LAGSGLTWAVGCLKVRPSLSWAAAALLPLLLLGLMRLQGRSLYDLEAIKRATTTLPDLPP